MDEDLAQKNRNTRNDTVKRFLQTACQNKKYAIANIMVFNFCQASWFYVMVCRAHMCNFIKTNIQFDLIYNSSIKIINYFSFALENEYIE